MTELSHFYELLVSNGILGISIYENAFYYRFINPHNLFLISPPIITFDLHILYVPDKFVGHQQGFTTHTLAR